MNKERLVSCETKEEVIREIVRQSMVVKEKTGYYNSKGDRCKTEGLYLRLKSNKENSNFDTLLYGFALAYTQSIEARIDGNHSEFLNDSIWDSVIMSYEILLNWINGKYNSIITPSTVEELVEIVFDDSINHHVTNYLFGIMKRLAKNLLSIVKKEDNNNFTVNPRKIMVHKSSENKQQMWEYRYVTLSSIDVTRNDEDDNIYSSDSRNNILDQHLWDNDMSPVLYEDKNNVSGKLEAILQLFTPEKANRIRKVFNNEENIDYKEAISLNCRTNIKVQREKGVEFYNLKFDKNDNICFGGDFVDFSWKLMYSNDLVEKFNMIKRALNRNDIVGDILTDIILDLDTHIYRQLFTYLRDENKKYVKYYVKSDNFRLILDEIIEMYTKIQNRFVEIYTFNESQRKQKIEKLKKKIHNVKTYDDIITSTNINKVYNSFIEEFELRDYISELKLMKMERKIQAFRDLGFELEAVSKQKYTIKEVS